jgi:hypothetical protein
LAQWNINPVENTPICSTPAGQSTRSGVVSTIDNFGSVFIAWVDSRTSANGSIYMQKVSLSNIQFFAEDGIEVATSATAISNLIIVPDLTGGVVLAWQSNNDIFGQRFDANGNAVWAGVKTLSAATANNQLSPQITLINLTEGMVVFDDNRNGNRDIFLNKFSLSTGDLLFANDVAICTATGTQTAFSIIPDVNNGAYIVWADPRIATSDANIFAQHVKNDGTIESGWIADGILICNASGNQSNPILLPDLAGGMYAVWEDFRSGNTDIYAQRLTSNGTALWTANGVVVTNPAGNQQLPQAIPYADAIIITWTDGRVASSNRNIFAQKLAAADGAVAWTANGIAVCEAIDNQPSTTSGGLRIVPDGTNGAIIVWNDQRSGNTNRDIYAQRVNSSGAVLWTANGVPVSTASGNQGPDLTVMPSTITNGAFVFWGDGRSGVNNTELYGALLDGSGNLSSAVSNRQPLEGKIKAYPVPATKDIYLSLSKVKPGTYTVQVIDISGRMLLQNKTAVTGTEGLIETKIEQLQSGVYFIKRIHESSKTESVFRFTKQ